MSQKRRSATNRFLGLTTFVGAILGASGGEGSSVVVGAITGLVVGTIVACMAIRASSNVRGFCEGPNTRRR